MLHWITAERTSSTLRSDNVTRQRQLAMYYKARDYLRGKSVLEIGCGEGAGTEILAEQADEIVALDYSEKALKVARKRPLSSGIRFQIQQVPPISAPDGKFDVVIMFQMIEHFENPGPLIEEIRRVLKKGGTFLVSTVNKEESLSRNPFHPREFDREELQAALTKYFAHLHIFGLYGDEKYTEYLNVNKRRVAGALKLDVFNISSKLPIGLRKMLYSAANRAMRVSLRHSNPQLCDTISHKNFIFEDDETVHCLDFLVACAK